MTSNSYLRKGLIASCLINCLVILAAGWLAGAIFSKVTEPEYIEMELISNAALKEPAPVPAATPRTTQVSQSVKSEQVRSVTAQRPAVNSSVPASTESEVAESYSPSTGIGSSGGSGDDAVPAVAPVGSGSSGNSAPAAPRQKIGPRVLSSVEPIYPDDARQDGATGTVYISIEVLENGHPGAVQVVSSSGRSSLDEAAVRAVRKWRFVPAQDENGHNMRCFTRLPVRFRLD